MGLSSSQARLLTLTGRMHDIEYKAAKLEAQKLQMANESRRVYDDYLVALDATKVQLKTIDTDGSIKYIDATYNNLVAAGYEITFKDYGYGLDPVAYANYVEATHNKTQFGNGNREYFAALQTNKTTASDGILAKGTDGVYEIYTSKQLAEVLNSNQTGKQARLMCDIDMSGETYSLHVFTNCKFDGNGHKITGLDKALFGQLTGTEVSNLSVSGNVTGDRGILVNTADGNSQITNVTVSGSVNSAGVDFVGGMIGSASHITVKQCSASVDVNACKYVGGFIGYVDNSTFENCSVSGTIYGEQRVGGFAAQVESSQVTKSSSACNVTVNSNNFPKVVGPPYAGNHPDSGAFISAIHNTTIDHCVARGSMTDLSGESDVLSDSLLNKPSVVTGFVALTQNSTITNSDSYADVTTTHTTYLCGFAADYSGASGTSTISHCNFYGTVSPGAGSESSANSDFATASTGHLNISNCYSSSNDLGFAKGGTLLTGQTTNASSAYANTISVTPPSINVTKSLGSEGDTWRTLFDSAVAKGGADVFDNSVSNPYGLNDHMNDNEWLTNLINEGYLYIYKLDTSKNESYQVSVATDTNLQEVQNEKDLRKAEAKYEADMKKIDMKDRRYDTELAALDSERNAIKAEMDTLKNVAKDNVDRTFKLFS